MSIDHIGDAVASIYEKVAEAAISINWRSSSNIASPSRRKGYKRGPGAEQLGLKIYDPADGDQASDIDPNASAAEADEDVYIVRTYKRPRMTSVNILLDVNKSMRLGTSGTFKSYLAAVAVGCGIKSADKVKDRASFVSYTDQPITVLKTRIASRLLTQALYAAVEDHGPEGEEDETPAATARQGLGATLKGLPSAALNLARTAGRALKRSPDKVEEIVRDGGGLYSALATTHQRDRSIYLIVSDFINMDEDDWEALRICGLKHDTIAVYVQDKRERELPAVPWPGMQYSLEDFRGETVSFWVAPDNMSNAALSLFRRAFGSVTTAKEYADNFQKFETSVIDRLEECGVTPVIVRTDEEDDAVQNVLGILASKLR